MPEITPHRIEVRQVKHSFTQDERNTIASDLARAIGEKSDLEAEFASVKSGYKARMDAAEATTQSLSTSIRNGFDHRPERCVVVFKPKLKKRHLYLESDTERNGEPVIVDDMTQDDYQVDLLQAESKFEAKEEIPLFDPTATDYGYLVVGRFKARWFTAIRVKIGAQKIDERLDSEQPCTKNRPDALRKAGKRFGDWLFTSCGKETAKGFHDGLAKVLEAHKEREE